jgi:hypothetical protein
MPAYFTPTQQAIMNLLKDEKSHHRDEIHALLPDDLGAPSNIGAHLTAIRHQIRGSGAEILCERREAGTYYRYESVSSFLVPD